MPRTSASRRPRAPPGLITYWKSGCTISHGAIAVNGAAGSGNQQANLAAIGIGIEGPVVSLEALSQTRSSQQPAGYQNDPDVTKAAEIGPDAFAQSSGVLQVNLTAGRDNSSANLFALSITEGADQ